MTISTKHWLQRAGFVLGGFLLSWYARDFLDSYHKSSPDPAALSQPADSAAGKPSRRLVAQQIADLHARLRAVYGQDAKDEHQELLAQIHSALEARRADIERLAEELYQQRGCKRFEADIQNRIASGSELPTWQETLDDLFWSLDFELEFVSSQGHSRLSRELEKIRSDLLEEGAYSPSLASMAALALHREKCIGEPVEGAVDAYQKHVAQQAAGQCDEAAATMQQIGDAKRMLNAMLYCSGATRDDYGRLIASADARQNFYDRLRSLPPEEVAGSASLIPMRPEPEYDRWRSACEDVYLQEGMAAQQATASCLGDIIMADPGHHDDLTPSGELGFTSDEMRRLTQQLPAVDYRRRCALLAAAQEELFDRATTQDELDRLIVARGEGVVPEAFYMDCLSGKSDNQL